MNDAILLAKTPDALNQLIQLAFEQLRAGDLLALGDSQLAECSAATSLLLTDSPSTMARGQAVATLLRWLTQQLQPGGERNWQDQSWLTYNILSGYYLERNSLAWVAEQIGYSDIHTSQTLRPRAIAAAAALLRTELTQRTHRQQLQQFAANAYAQGHSAETQTILQMLAITDDALPLDLLYQLAQPISAEVPAILQTLHDDHAITIDAQHARLHPRLRAPMRLRTPPDRRNAWLQTAAAFYRPSAPLLAADLYLQAGQPSESADLLVARAPTLIRQADEAQLAELDRLLQALKPRAISAESAIQLQKIHAELLEFSGDMQAAQREYEQLLASDQIDIKAFALYRLAELTKQQNSIALAQATYQRGIDLLTQSQSDPDLLVRLYLGRAMIYNQEHQDLDLAFADLQQAEHTAEISAERIAKTTLSDLHNALASYYYYRKAHNQELTHRHQAWLAALESDDTYRMLNTVHNLGQAHAWLKQVEPAEQYLERGLKLARSSGNQQFVGSLLKSLGNVYYWQEAFERAEAAYLEAYATFVSMNNRNWMGYVCHDLCELYATTGEWQKARRYHGEGVALAQELGNQMLLTAMADLETTYAAISAELNERQRLALAYLHQHPDISNKDYCDITGCSPMTATRDLNDAVAQGILAKVGKGRATRYVKNS